MSLQDNIKAAQIDLVSELGIDKLPEEQQKDLLAQISEVLQQRIVLRLVEEMPEEKKEDFGKVLQEGEKNPDKIEKFLNENLPNLEELVLDEIGKYKTEAKQFIDENTGEKEDKKPE